jgi:hypothetical protein
LINKIANFIAKISPEGVQGRPSNSQQRQQAQQQARQPAMDMSRLSSTGQANPAATQARAYNPGMGMAQGIA